MGFEICFGVKLNGCYGWKIADRTIEILFSIRLMFSKLVKVVVMTYSKEVISLCQGSRHNATPLVASNGLEV